MSKIDISRRYFSILSARLIAVISAAGLLNWSTNPHNTNVSEIQNTLLKEHFKNIRSANLIGEKYIHQYGVNASEVEMRQQVFSGLSAYSTVAFSDHISRKVKQDFKDENMVNVDGYLLSKTEIDLCALCFYIS